jgi:hypothetical protein
VSCAAETFATISAAPAQRKLALRRQGLKNRFIGFAPVMYFEN